MGINLNYSPIRYPGGKRKLTRYIYLLLKKNKLLDGHYVEPYAGGASVALSLLLNNCVKTIHINDYDKRIYAFWYSILNHTNSFCQKIKKTKVDITNWEIQKEIQKEPYKFDIFEIGFSTFFLNRTNRSGILKAGAIGGKAQLGKWKLDARYNKEELIKRIKKISDYKRQIKLYNRDAFELIKYLDSNLPQKTFFYFDPPYYTSGKELYINFYEHSDHKKMAQLIKSLKNRYWLVSYDENHNIKKLYNTFYQKIYKLNYHASRARKGTEILIFSGNQKIPSIKNPIDTSEIKNFESFNSKNLWLCQKELITSP